jgi:hypothetical protein
MKEILEKAIKQKADLTKDRDELFEILKNYGTVKKVGPFGLYFKVKRWFGPRVYIYVDGVSRYEIMKVSGFTGWFYSREDLAEYIGTLL